MTRPQFSRKEILYDLNNNNLPGQQMFNGSTWDKQYNNMQGTLLASASRTANVNSPTQTNYNAKGIILFLNVSSAPTTPGAGSGLQLNIINPDPINSQWFYLNPAPAKVTTIGQYYYIIYPGVANGSNASQIISIPLPRTWLVNMAVGNADSYTYQLSYSYIL